MVQPAAGSRPGVSDDQQVHVPSAHDPVEPNQTLLNECAEPTEDITFTLEGEAGTASASTGEGGSPATIHSPSWSRGCTC